VGLAEDLAHGALVAALEQWPQSGIPDKPGAWLMVTAKHHAIDQIRRNVRLERKTEEIGRDLELEQSIGVPEEIDTDEDLGDDLLRLIFIACHPILSKEARLALTLRLLGGLTTDEIARAFLVPEPTIAQRIVRAKRTLSEARIPFEVPAGGERVARLSSVLEAIYLIFNEGYSATSGDDWIRPALCEDALRLGRVLAELIPNEPEVHGLVALMEIQASRLRARVGSSGEAIPLLEQNRGRWDQLLIQRGFAALIRAEAVGGAGRGPPGNHQPDRVRQIPAATGDDGALGAGDGEERRLALDDHMNRTRLIKTQRDYHSATRRIEALMDARPNTPQGDELELLSTLVDLYEKHRFPVESPDPIEAIRFRMEQAGLTPADLVPYIGSRSRVSEVLNRKRPLSIQMIRRLHHGLGIPAEVLIAEPRHRRPAA
jgi:RNA polymerase sigma factor (sigma-70 family)